MRFGTGSESRGSTVPVTLLGRGLADLSEGVEILGIPFHVEHEGPGRVHFNLVVETYGTGQLVCLDLMIAEAALAEMHEDGDETLFVEARGLAGACQALATFLEKNFPDRVNSKSGELGECIQEARDVPLVQDPQ